MSRTWLRSPLRLCTLPCLTGTRVERRCAAGSLPVGRRCQTTLRSKCTARLHQGKLTVDVLRTCETFRLYCVPDLPTFEELCDTLNSHYANVSTDFNYTPPSLKLTAVSDDQDYISEWSVFKALDTLRPTAAGLDQIPAWFLRLGAAVFCKPLAYLFDQSIASSSVPLQWKQAMISPSC